MSIVTKPDLQSLIADKAALRKLMEEQDRRSSFVPVPTATPQKARELMLAEGVRPEDNVGSRDIIRMREGEDE